jgi:hypothetical protein
VPQAQGCEEAKRRIEHVLGKLGLKLHPQKTRRVVLTQGREGFDFLGCHLHKRMSGRLWQQKGLRRYYLQLAEPQGDEPVRARVRELTPRWRCHQDVRSVIAELNPVLRGWGQYFQTGNAANHFIDVDAYVVKRLRSLRVKRAGRSLRAGQAQRWDREYFESLGLHRLRGTIRYPGKPPGNGSPRNAASRQTTGKPCAGNPHARFERGRWLCEALPVIDTAPVLRGRRRVGLWCRSASRNAPDTRSPRHARHDQPPHSPRAGGAGSFGGHRPGTAPEDRSRRHWGDRGSRRHLAQRQLGLPPSRDGV